MLQEKLFRKLYDKVREMDESDIDFSMDTSVVKDQVDSWLCVVFSKTIFAFHGTIVLTILIVMFVVLAIT